MGKREEKNRRRGREKDKKRRGTRNKLDYNILDKRPATKKRRKETEGK